MAPNSGTAPGNLVVSVTPTGLAAGSYSGSIVITPAGNAPQTIAVTLVVSNTALLVLSQSSVSFNVTAGSSSSQFQSVTITSTDGTPLPFTVNTGNASWLLVSPTSGTTPTVLQLTANPTGPRL